LGKEGGDWSNLLASNLPEDWGREKEVTEEKQTSTGNHIILLYTHVVGSTDSLIMTLIIDNPCDFPSLPQTYRSFLSEFSPEVC
jgi:hypothetical protein